MFEQKRWPHEAWVPVIAGLLWLWSSASFGVVGFLFSLIPGCLLLASGVSTLLYPGDVRISQFTAAGGLLGIPFAVPAFIVAGSGTGLLLLLLSALSFIAAGSISIRQEPHCDEVPEPQPSLGLALQAAVDDAILASLTVRARTPHDSERVAHEVSTARALFEERGWLESPADYHVAPPSLEHVQIDRARALGIDYEHLRFSSGYEPHADEPGRERWLGYSPNRTAHAWILRQGAESRPWLICIPGYEMGRPALDFAGFRVRQLIEDARINVAIPVLPFHGPRRVGRSSGDGFLAGEFLDTVHAEAQAMWDIRRLLTWIRAQTDKPVGVTGLSLGGYNASLFSGLADDLACVIAGIPATDFLRLTWRHGPVLQLRYAERHGLIHDEIAEVLRVVSPLAFDCRVAQERRYIFAGVADRLVPPDQPCDLWRHWERCAIAWYQGGHVTFRAHPHVRQFVRKALHESGLSA